MTCVETNVICLYSIYMYIYTSVDVVVYINMAFVDIEMTGVDINMTCVGIDMTIDDSFRRCIR